MRVSKKYSGVVIPMVTPVNEKGKIDQDSAIKVFKHLIDSETFPFLLGTTGEAASVPAASKTELFKCVIDTAPENCLVYAGISDNCMGCRKIDTKTKPSSCNYNPASPV